MPVQEKSFSALPVTVRGQTSVPDICTLYIPSERPEMIVPVCGGVVFHNRLSGIPAAPVTSTVNEPPVLVWQFTVCSMITSASIIYMSLVNVEGALSGPLAVRVTVYFPGPENV